MSGAGRANRFSAGLYRCAPAFGSLRSCNPWTPLLRCMSQQLAPFARPRLVAGVSADWGRPTMPKPLWLRESLTLAV